MKRWRKCLPLQHRKWDIFRVVGQGAGSLEVENRALERWTHLKLHGLHRPWSFRVLEIPHIDQMHIAIYISCVWMSHKAGP